MMLLKYPFRAKTWIYYSVLLICVVPPPNPKFDHVLVNAIVLKTCDAPLGVESGELPDEVFSSSSSYVPSVDARYGRLKNERAGGGWCPKNQLSRNVREYVEVDLGHTYLLTAVQTQGRYDKGRGQEFTEQYHIEYKRPFVNEYLTYRRYTNDTMLIGNRDTTTVTMQRLLPPIIARQFRIVPYSYYLRSVCLRFELNGCTYTNPVVRYFLPVDPFWSENPDIGDVSYDGYRNGDFMVNGLGRLVDGIYGLDSSSLDLALGTGSAWIGWKNETFAREFIELTFEFDTYRAFDSVTLYANNDFKKGVQVFAKAQILFSFGGHHYNSEMIHFEHTADLTVEAARNVTILCNKNIARFMKIRLFFASIWVMVGEIVFESEIAVGNFTHEEESIPNDNVVRMYGGPTDPPWEPPLFFDDEKGQMKYFWHWVVGGLAITSLVLFKILICILIYKRMKNSANNVTENPDQPPPVAARANPFLQNRPTTNVRGARSAQKSLVRFHRDQVQTELVARGTPFSENVGDLRMVSRRTHRPNGFVYYETGNWPPPAGTSTRVNIDGPPNAFVNSNDQIPTLMNPNNTHACRRGGGRIFINTLSVVEDASPPSPQSPITGNIYEPSPEDPIPLVKTGWNIIPIISLPRKYKETDIIPLPREQLKVIGELGSCHLGTVTLCEAINLGNNLTNNIRLVVARSCKGEAVNQIRYLMALRDVNLVKFYGVCTAEQPPWLVIDHQCDLGDLPTVLRAADNEILYSTMLGMACHIASAMKYLESKNLVHKDLAARNCLVCLGFNVKVTDTAISQVEYELDYVNISESRPQVPIRWLPWESIIKDEYHTSIWSFGVTLWEICSKAMEVPYSNYTDEQYLRLIEETYTIDTKYQNPVLPKPFRCSTDVYELMCQCWMKQHHARPSYKTIYSFLRRHASFYTEEIDDLCKKQAKSTARTYSQFQTTRL